MGVSSESEAALKPVVAEERVSSIEPKSCSLADPAASTQSARVSGALLCACRASFVECGHWDGLRMELAARMHVEAEALDDLTANDWLELASLTALLEAQLAFLDLEGLKTRVRRRVSDAERGHVFASMLRSWTRSFASGEHMLRALGPLFRAGLRNVEVPRVRGIGSSEAHVLLRGALFAPLQDSEALRAAFEGLLLGLLDLARPRPMLPEVELTFERDELCAVCRF